MMEPVVFSWGERLIHVNVTKTLLVGAGAGFFLWVLLVKTAPTAVKAWAFRLEGSSEKTFVLLTAAIGVLFAVFVGALNLEQYLGLTAEGGDLAQYSSAVWNTLHGDWFFNSFSNEHWFGFHFSPYLLILAPLYRVWESPVWLLLIQASALGLGAVALGLLAKKLNGDKTSAFIMVALYCANLYVHSISALSYHSSVLAIPIFLWMLYCVETGRYISAGALVVTALMIEESLTPGLVGAGLYLLAFRPRWRIFGTAVAVIGVTWFLLSVGLWMPHFGEGGLQQWYQYSQLGPDFPHALRNLVTNPFALVSQALLSNFKVYYLFALLGSVGFLPVFAWREAALIILPALVMLLSQDGSLYKFGFHHSAHVLPFLFYSATHGLARLQLTRYESPKLVRAFAAVLFFLLTVNVAQINGYRLSRIDSARAEAASLLMGQIPSDTKVRADGPIIAWLSTRRHVTWIRDKIEDNYRWWIPDYVVFDRAIWDSNADRRTARIALIDDLLRQGRYELIADDHGFMLFQATGKRMR